MNKKQREDITAFIFETGRAMRFYMDEFVLSREEAMDPLCTELTTIQQRAMLQVWLRQPLSLGELARSLQVTPSAASTLVDKLVEKELLLRQPDPADRRRVVIEVHPQAEDMMNRINEQFLKAFRSVVDHVPDESLIHWHEALQSVATILKEKAPA